MNKLQIRKRLLEIDAHLSQKRLYDGGRMLTAKEYHTARGRLVYEKTRLQAALMEEKSKQNITPHIRLRDAISKIAQQYLEISADGGRSVVERHVYSAVYRQLKDVLHVTAT